MVLGPIGMDCVGRFTYSAHMFRHVLDFALSVAHHWEILVAGTVLSAAVAVWERYHKKPIAGWLFRSVIVASLVIAFFLAWQDERLKVEHFTTNRTLLTPKELVAVFVGRTTGQGNELARVYIGKWIEVAGTISDISPFGFGMFTQESFITLQTPNEPTIFVRFGHEWNSKLSVLRAGEKIKVYGQISDIYNSGIWLSNGEITELPH